MADSKGGLAKLDALPHLASFPLVCAMRRQFLPLDNNGFRGEFLEVFHTNKMALSPEPTDEMCAPVSIPKGDYNPDTETFMETCYRPAVEQWLKRTAWQPRVTRSIAAAITPSSPSVAAASADGPSFKCVLHDRLKKHAHAISKVLQTSPSRIVFYMEPNQRLEAIEKTIRAILQKLTFVDDLLKVRLVSTMIWSLFCDKAKAALYLPRPLLSHDSIHRAKSGVLIGLPGGRQVPDTGATVETESLGLAVYCRLFKALAERLPGTRWHVHEPLIHSLIAYCLPRDDRTSWNCLIKGGCFPMKLHMEYAQVIYIKAMQEESLFERRQPPDRQDLPTTGLAAVYEAKNQICSTIHDLIDSDVGVDPTTFGDDVDIALRVSEMASECMVQRDSEIKMQCVRPQSLGDRLLPAGTWQTRTWLCRKLPHTEFDVKTCVKILVQHLHVYHAEEVARLADENKDVVIHMIPDVHCEAVLWQLKQLRFFSGLPFPAVTASYIPVAGLKQGIYETFLALKAVDMWFFQRISALFYLSDLLDIPISPFSSAVDTTAFAMTPSLLQLIQAQEASHMFAAIEVVRSWFGLSPAVYTPELLETGTQVIVQVFGLFFETWPHPYMADHSLRATVADLIPLLAYGPQDSIQVDTSGFSAFLVCFAESETKELFRQRGASGTLTQPQLLEFCSDVYQVPDEQFAPNLSAPRTTTALTRLLRAVHANTKEPSAALSDRPHPFLRSTLEMQASHRRMSPMHDLKSGPVRCTCNDEEEARKQTKLLLHFLVGAELLYTVIPFTERDQSHCSVEILHSIMTRQCDCPAAFDWPLAIQSSDTAGVTFLYAAQVVCLQRLVLDSSVDLMEPVAAFMEYFNSMFAKEAAKAKKQQTDPLAATTTTMDMTDGEDATAAAAASAGDSKTAATAAVRSYPTFEDLQRRQAMMAQRPAIHVKLKTVGIHAPPEPLQMPNKSSPTHSPTSPPQHPPTENFIPMPKRRSRSRSPSRKDRDRDRDYRERDRERDRHRERERERERQRDRRPPSPPPRANHRRVYYRSSYRSSVSTSTDSLAQRYGSRGWDSNPYHATKPAAPAPSSHPPVASVISSLAPLQGIMSQPQPDGSVMVSMRVPGPAIMSTVTPHYQRMNTSRG